MSVKVSVSREAKKGLQNQCETHNSRFGTCSANPPRGNKNTQASPMSPGGLQGSSLGLIWAIWEPSGSLVRASRHLMGAIWEPSGGLVEAFRGFMGAFKTLEKHASGEQYNNTLHLHNSTTRHHPSAWPGGMREAA